MLGHREGRADRRTRGSDGGPDAGGEGLDVPDLVEPPVHAGLHQLPQATHVGGDDRAARGARLEHHERGVLGPPGAEDEGGGSGEGLGGVGDRAGVGERGGVGRVGSGRAVEQEGDVDPRSCVRGHDQVGTLVVGERTQKEEGPTPHAGRTRAHAVREVQGGSEPPSCGFFANPPTRRDPDGAARRKTLPPPGSCVDLLGGDGRSAPGGRRAPRGGEAPPEAVEPAGGDEGSEAPGDAEGERHGRPILAPGRCAGGAVGTGARAGGALAHELPAGRAPGPGVVEGPHHGGVGAEVGVEVREVVHVHHIRREGLEPRLDPRARRRICAAEAQGREGGVGHQSADVGLLEGAVHRLAGRPRRGEGVHLPAACPQRVGRARRDPFGTGVLPRREPVNDLDEARHAVEGVRAGYPPRVESPRVRVLVVDDEENLRHLLELILSRAGYAVVTCANGREALTRLREADIVLCDIRMPEMDGLAFLDARPADAPPVVMMSAYGTVETALEAIRRGAYDYVSKPFKADEIVLTLRKLQEREQLAAERSRLALENARLSMRLGEPVEGFVGHAPSIVELLRVLSRAANHDSSVLLTGESGTGKELLANALHRLSPRRDKPWVAVNCAAIPEPLLESELFGHRRGAFTGAVRDHAGLFEQADGGTLFLDEIGELPVALQAKLLRTLQEGTVRRIGGSGEVEVDVRIVAATAASLAAPRFREDLFYRVAVVHLQIPPLRERAEDIPLLVDHLLTGLCARMRLARPTVSDGAMRALVGHRWPGNVRQLENVLERALLVSDDELLDVNALPAEMASPDAGLVLGDTLSIPQRTAALERSLIREALKLHQGNKAAAARSLELSYKALLYKIRDYGLEGG